MKIKLKEIIVLVLFIVVVSAVAIFIKNAIRDKNQEKEIEALINVEFKGEPGSGDTDSGSVEEKKEEEITVTGNAIAVLQIPSQGIRGVVKLLGKLEDEQKTKFTQMLEGIAKLGTIKIVVVDSIDAIKGLNYESWFKALAQLSEGIWMGNGISNQFTLKVTTNARLLRAEIDETMGYVIKKGKAVLIKLASDE